MYILNMCFIYGPLTIYISVAGSHMQSLFIAHCNLMIPGGKVKSPNRKLLQIRKPLSCPDPVFWLFILSSFDSTSGISGVNLDFSGYGSIGNFSSTRLST